MRASLCRILEFTCLCLLLGAIAYGQEQPGRGPRQSGRNTRDFLGLGPAPDAAAAARGEKLYAPNCAFCHGAKANGAEGPDLVRSAVVLHDEKGELIGPVIHNGRADKGMPAFANFTPEQLVDLAQFLHLRVDLAANRGLYKPLNVVTGNAAAGQAYFAAQCASCHAADGDLAHIGAKMAPADLQQAFLYPGARGYEPGAPKIARVTVTLPGGQVLTGSLKRLDDFHVSLYDAQGVYHSVALEPGVKVQVDDTLAPHRRLLDRYTDSEIHNLTAYLTTLK